MSTRVKICGITRLPDAELAVELGAWALGMIFYEGSPRSCSLTEAQRISATLRRRVELCGVFVNASLEHVIGTAEQLQLTLLQLHGDEGPSFCGEVARRTGARVIKAAQVSGQADVQDIARFHVDFHLLDARSSEPGEQGLRGGTGKTFDWGLLANRRSSVPLILSGGLNAGNVADAIARVSPFAIDSASGTESAPGIKDQGKLTALFEAVHATANEPQRKEPLPAPLPAPGSVGSPA
jgi:phosphoribosylanthranilate isomerase